MERRSEEGGGKKKGRNFLVAAFWSAIIIALVKWAWPELIPFDVFGFWHMKGSVWDWLAAGWPLIAVGFGLNVALVIYNRIRNDPSDERVERGDALDAFIGGTVISVLAGVLEEIAFRWLIFLAAIATIRIPNFLFFGFLGFGIPEWFHMNIWGPIADWTTLGHLHHHIFNAHGWMVGAAMLYANAFFRDGHKYQGLIGVVNSWFCGMFFFWMMFAYGLPAAILIHFLYDFVIFSFAAWRIAITPE